MKKIKIVSPESYYLFLETGIEDDLLEVEAENVRKGERYVLIGVGFSHFIEII